MGECEGGQGDLEEFLQNVSVQLASDDAEKYQNDDVLDAFDSLVDSLERYHTATYDVRVAREDPGLRRELLMKVRDEAIRLAYSAMIAGEKLRGKKMGFQYGGR